MSKISVVIITLNEERNIERCLCSVNWADEIIVVDSGSTDATLDICRRQGCRIVPIEWQGYGKAKQRGVEEAKNDWIFSIDADEEATPELRLRLQQLASAPTAEGYRIRRRSFYLGKLVRFSGWRNDYPLRFFNRRFGRYNDKVVHEGVEVQGRVGVIQEPLLHYTFPTVSSHLQKIERYARLGAEEKAAHGKKSSVGKAVLRGMLEFLRIFVMRLGFLDGRRGLVLAVNSAFAAYVKYLMLWEMTERPNQLY
ncbi:MAG: glycosyltransferase family 2 protein [candidate division KSB1 bacterium]|nr:glycosyltransferase family 2 protein [candidate division KSB1 bacterium]